jgi:hypothetical protein
MLSDTGGVTDSFTGVSNNGALGFRRTEGPGRRV